MNVKKSLTKLYVIKGLFRVLIIVDVNLINCKFVNLYVINCKFRKKLVYKLVEECSENTDGNKIIHNGYLIDYENVCNSGTMYIVLFVIAFLIIIGISSAFAYKEIIVMLRLIPILKQQFIKNINGKYQLNKYQKLNILLF